MAPTKKSQKTGSEAEPDFETQLKQLGLNTETLARLQKHGFAWLESLELLAEEADAIAALQLSLAQRLVLKRYLNTVRVGATPDLGKAPQQTPARDGAIGGAEPNTQTTATLDVVLSQLREGHQVGTMRPASEPALSWSTDTMACYRGGCEAVKVYEIVDYINLIPPITEEQVITEHGTLQFIIRSAAKKPRLAVVTVEEWCLANTRIVEMVMERNPAVFKDYLEYTMKVCELLKCYEKVSVLQYDHKYRHMQAHFGFRWGTDMPHVSTHSSSPAEIHRCKWSRQHGTGQRTGFSRWVSMADGRIAAMKCPVCYQFNSNNGFTYGTACRFRHACSEPRCFKDHSRINHGSKE